MRPAPPWLAELQAHFGAVLRTPLDRSTNTLRATPELYTTHISVRGDLAVYNRQYWFRLFDTFATALPLTMRLFGAWHLNDYVACYLLERPPSSWDLEECTLHFSAWLDDHLDPHTWDHQLRREAARIDTAWLTLFRSPAVEPFAPSAKDAARLLDAHLLPSPAVARIAESAALLDLRAECIRSPGERAIAAPPPLPAPRHWLLVRDGARTIPHALTPLEAELHRLLEAHTVRDALAQLERTCPEDERATLPTNTQRWLARAVKLGCFTGLS